MPPCQDLNDDTIRAQMVRILQSKTLARAAYLRRLLKACVEETLAGNSSQLKELWLGTTVFLRKSKYVPVRDPIVRVQARRLRQKLAEYYASEGLVDPIRITLPLGTYVPVFSSVDPDQWSGFHNGGNCSIAVLPITSLDADDESARFADSMTAELTHALVEAGGMEVVSRTSAAAFKGVAQDIRSIGKSLAADFIVEGCTHFADNRHRVSLQLTATETGYHCWAAWFEHRNSGNGLYARNIAHIMRLELSAGSAPRVLTAGGGF